MKIIEIITKAFLPGKIYYTKGTPGGEPARIRGGAPGIISVTVAKRTRCFIICTDGRRHKVRVNMHGVEYILPWGLKDCCPVIFADREAITN